MIADSKIAGCFGANLVFGGNPLEDEYAFEPLGDLRRRGTAWKEVSTAFRKFLKQKGCAADHTGLQMAALERHYRPWLG